MTWDLIYPNDRLDLMAVMGSEQVEAGFEVIPEPLGQEIRTGQPDPLKGRSGFTYQTDPTRCPGVQIDPTRSYFGYIKGLDRPDRRAGPGRGRVPVDCNVKIIYESDPAQYFVTIAFSNAKAHGAHRVTISTRRGVNRTKGVRITCGGKSR
jgi:hypothetical protein